MDLRNGDHHLLAKELTRSVHWSPQGNHLLYFDNTKLSWVVVDPLTKQQNILTDVIPFALYDELYDPPNPAPPYGLAGWSRDGKNAIVYDRFDGVEVTEEELDLFKKLSHMGRTLVIFNDGPVALENDQYTIYNDLTVEEKLEKMDSLIGPIVYIGDSFKDIVLLQKSYVGISRGGLADSKVVENSDIVLIDSDLNKVYETFLIARKMRTIAVGNNILTIFMKLAVLVAVISFTALPLWIAILVEMMVSAFVMSSSTFILE